MGDPHGDLRMVGRDLTPTSSPNVRTLHTRKPSTLSNIFGQRQVTVSPPIQSHCTAVLDVLRINLALVNPQIMSRHPLRSENHGLV